MKNILFVLSSPRGWKSYSHQFAGHIVDDLKARHPDAKVVVRDVAKEPLPHVGEAFATGRYPTRWWTSSPRLTSSCSPFPCTTSVCLPA